jgi:hypothetical protein
VRIPYSEQSKTTNHLVAVLAIKHELLHHSEGDSRTTVPAECFNTRLIAVYQLYNGTFSQLVDDIVQLGRTYMAIITKMNQIKLILCYDTINNI